MKLEKEQDLLLKDLLKLITVVIEQNSQIIKNENSKQEYIIELLEALVEEDEDNNNEEDIDEIYKSLD